MGWALYLWTDPSPEIRPDNYYEIVALLVAAGATMDPEWLADPDRGRPIVQKIQAERRMLRALRGKISGR